MVAAPEIAAAAALILTSGAELMHARRIAQVDRLAFGPKRKPTLLAAYAGYGRVLAVAALVWGLLTLIDVEPRVYKAKAVSAEKIQHVVIVLDVSPSMKLKDAGESGDMMRRERAYQLMQSFFKRVAAEQMRLSLVATYNGAKPVVVDTADVDVVHNFLDGVDMHSAFEIGKTKIFDGLEEAARVAADWRRDSTTIVLISDGDTVPASGMPKMPKSVRGVLVIGVGDPTTGMFLDGRNSKQDVSTLRQIALRLGGTYHDGNTKHLPTETIIALTKTEDESPFDKLTRREYALAACAIGALTLALLPLMLNLWGTRWRPGIDHKLLNADS